MRFTGSELQEGPSPSVDARSNVLSQTLPKTRPGVTKWKCFHCYV